MDAERELHLLLVGDGPLRSALESLASELGIGDRVHLVGQQKDVASWYPLIDVYVNCSHSEGMSQSLVEAMSANLPVIATDVGDAVETIGHNGSCGKLIKPGSTGELVNAIRELLPDEERMHASRCAGMRYAKEFTTQQMAQRYARLYERVIAGSAVPEPTYQLTGHDGNRFSGIVGHCPCRETPLCSAHPEVLDVHY